MWKRLGVLVIDVLIASISKASQSFGFVAAFYQERSAVSSFM
jgi:hypothetical protein